MGQKEEEASASREYTLARLAVVRGALASASSGLDEILVLFVAPDDDKKGSKRSELLEAIDESIGIAATAVQSAQTSWEDCDPGEGEPEEEEEEEEEEAEESRPPRRGRA
jgi:hypothetical protein